MGKKKKGRPEREEAADQTGTDSPDTTDVGDADSPMPAADGEGLSPVPEEAVESAATEGGEIQRLSDELAEANDRLLRLAAEFDNYKKRTAREQAESRARAQGEVVRQLLEALDDLERVAGLEESDATVHDVVAGVHMVERKLQQELEVLGTERVAQQGDAFDPHFHEAIGALPVPEDEEAGTIASVVQRGYKLGTTLLRAAKVLVYIAPEVDETNGEPDEG